MKINVLFLLLLAGLFTNQATAQTASKSIDKNILAVNQAFMQAFAAGAWAISTPAMPNCFHPTAGS